MGSGIKRMIINTQERAISPDINRLQAFAGKGHAEFLRYMMDVTGNDDLDAGAVVTEYASLGTPLRAEIANGILVRPQDGSLDVLIDPGALYAIAPDADADASNYKFVETAGVSILGSLVMTANASGFPRIDVIECEVNPDVVVETDSRDIFNASTGLFTAASVSKARENQLTFRVRAGTPNAGFPGVVSGWLPLAVASVPTGTVDNDTITFWDVRPILADRTRGPFAQTEDMPQTPKLYGYINAEAGPTATLAGHVRAGAVGQRVGGILRRGSPGTDGATIVLTDAANKESGLAYGGARAVYYLYLLLPFGLPRWARYTDSGGARVPRSPRGIPLVSTTPPSGVSGVPSAPIAFPSVFGFAGATTQVGVCIGSFPASTITELGAIAPWTTSFNGSKSQFGYINTNYDLPAPATPDANTLRWTLIPGTQFPANAKRVLVNVSGRVQVNAAQALSNFVYARVWKALFAGSGAAEHLLFLVGTTPLSNPTGGIISMDFSVGEFWVPVPTLYPGGVGGGGFDVDMYGPIWVAFGSGMSIRGWEV